MSDQPPPPNAEHQPGRPGSYPPGQYPPGQYPPGYPPQGYYQQPPPKKRRVWPWILIGVVVLFFGGCFAIIAGMSGGDDATVTSGGGGDNQPADSGLTFPGKQSGDTAANAGDSVTLDDVATTTTPLFDTTTFSTPYLCTTITINNAGNTSASFNTFDWKLQDPAGAIRNSSFTGTENQLNSGEVAPGGTASGDVCFDNPQGSPPGQYVVLNDPSFVFSSDRIGWINQR
ncbi:DUF4352 domain-containing protein [Rhodococcus sp. NPDC057529]|uniref:DUF4352 domain-containing protein n=1 Tax=Rhodococcus sp. NPDC057529 TaxID=3346158 RepID=UPI00367223BE